MPKTASVHLNDELAEQLERLAVILDRPLDWVLEQAIARYLDDEAQQVAAIAEALADYENGTAVLVPHEDVIQRLDAKIAAWRAERHPHDDDRMA